MHPNERLMREADEAMERGDMETFWAAHADDVVVHIAGTSSLAGTYKGKDQLQELFGRFIERAGDYSFEAHDYLASDDHVVALQRSHYNKDGRRLDTDDIFIVHVRDGKIAEFWMSSFDQAATDAFLG